MHGATARTRAVTLSSCPAVEPSNCHALRFLQHIGRVGLVKLNSRLVRELLIPCGMTLITSPLVSAVIGCAVEVHKVLGPGLLESAYDRCLQHEMNLNGIRYACQVPVPVTYKGVTAPWGYRVDFLIEEQLVVEVKTVDRLLPIHQAQVMTYLKLLQIRQGLLLNFNATTLVNGLKSVML